MKTCKLDIDANIFKRHDAKSNMFRNPRDQ